MDGRGIVCGPDRSLNGGPLQHVAGKGLFAVWTLKLQVSPDLPDDTSGRVILAQQAGRMGIPSLSILQTAVSMVPRVLCNCKILLPSWS